MGAKQSKRKKLSKDDINFLLDSTSFDKKQIKEWYEGFIADCPGGELSRKKFKEVYQQFFPAGKAEAFCEHVFRTFDTDNSGKIDFKEFLQAINITSNGKPEQKLSWAFKMYDIDGNGTIDKQEMLRIVQAIYDMVGQPAEGTDTPEIRTEKIFHAMDENGDGVLTREEFVKGCMQDELLYQMLTADSRALCNGGADDMDD